MSRKTCRRAPKIWRLWPIAECAAHIHDPQAGAGEPPILALILIEHY